MQLPQREGRCLIFLNTMHAQTWVRFVSSLAYRQAVQDWGTRREKYFEGENVRRCMNQINLPVARENSSFRHLRQISFMAKKHKPL